MTQPTPHTQRATTLYVAEQHGTADLAAVLAQWAPSMGEAVAMIADPARFALARLDHDGTPRGADGEALALPRAFEARVFDGRCELRWLRDGDTAHVAIIAEEPRPGLDGPATEVIARLDRTELLWGEIVGRDRGWVRTHEARVGELEVPLQSATRSRRVALRIREYVTDTGVDGNAAVSHERIIGFEEMG